MGTWVKSGDKLDWWSAKDFCESMDLVMTSRQSFCNYNGTGGEYTCYNQPTATRVGNYGYEGNALWLDSENACKAYQVRSDRQRVLGNTDKTAKKVTICHEPNYTEPQCVSGTYDISSNTCQQVCWDFCACIFDENCVILAL